MKFLIMQSSPVSHHLHPLRYKYSPQISVLKHPQSMPSVNARAQVSHPCKTRGKIMILYI